MKESKSWTRREILAMATGISALMSVSPILGQTENLEFTPSLIMGPFYPQIKPVDQDGDLTLVRGHDKRAEGKIIHVAGRVLNVHGVPIRGARIEVWQGKLHGRNLDASS